MKILFICLGNICRSCTAEEIMRATVARAGLSDKVVTDSAGLIDYHQGELPDSRMRACALSHGYRLTHRSRPVVQADFSTADLLVCMDDNNVARLRRLSSDEIVGSKAVRMGDYLRSHPAYRYIPDPYYGGPAEFELVVELLEDACQGLLEAIRPRLT